MTDPRVQRLVRSVISTTHQGDILRVLGAKPRTDRQVAWVLNAALDRIRAHLEKLKAKGLVKVVGQRRRRSGAIDDVFAPTSE